MYERRSKEFLITPLHHQTNDVLDFKNKDDTRYYPRGGKPLFYEREDKFDCTPKNLNNFLQDMDERLQEYGWEYNGTGIAWVNRGVVMIYKSPY